MAEKIQWLAPIEFGIVPTHIMFAGGLVPGADGRFPRDSAGEMLVLSEMQRLCRDSPAPLNAVQLPFFAGADAADTEALIAGMRALGLNVHLILMVGGADPMNPADEDAVVTQLVGSLKLAKRFGIERVASTSIEEWMKAGSVRRDGEEFTAAVAQNVRVHTRAYEEAGLADSSVKSWTIEFLRPGEFQTFTDLDRAWTFIKAVNEALGRDFFDLLVDAAHCGDSGMPIAETAQLVEKISAAGDLGVFHASCKTTRGCLSTDDGWIAALLTAAARGGGLKSVFVEVFHHQDPGLEALRDLDSGHGIDTRDGRDYSTTVLDGVRDVSRRINNLVARGILKP